MYACEYSYIETQKRAVMCWIADIGMPTSFLYFLHSDIVLFIKLMTSLL